MRMQAETRRAMIVSAIVRMAVDKGLAGVTHGGVVKYCVIRTSKSSLRKYFPTQKDLWEAAHDYDPVGFKEQAIELGLISGVGDAK